MQHFVTDAAMFTLRDCWFCVIDKSRCTNDGTTGPSLDGDTVDGATVMGRVRALIQPVDKRVPY